MTGKLSVLGPSKLRLAIFVICWYGASQTGVNARNYTGYRVIRTFPLDINEGLQLLKELDLWANSSQTLYSVWGSPNEDQLDLAVHPDKVGDVIEMLERRHIPMIILINDVKRIFKRSKGSSCLCTSDRSKYEIADPLTMNWCSYHRMKEIHEFMDEKAAKHSPKVEVENIGHSFEGRRLKILKINTANSSNIFWIDSGAHAREWIAPAVVTYMIRMMVDEYPKYKRLVDAFQWYFLPIMNPDGYEFSHTEDRMWTKTRSDQKSIFKCKGVDPDRNFNFQWMVGSSQDECSDSFAGRSPETEREVQAVRDMVMQLTRRGQVVAFFSFHSYAQVWASPWGWSTIHPRTYPLLLRVARAGANAIKKVYGTDYQVGTVADKLGISSGSSTGWAFGAAKIPFVYRIELRDEGNFGYALPPEQILPTAVETFAGLKAAAEEINKVLQEKKNIMMTLQEARKRQNNNINNNRDSHQQQLRRDATKNSARLEAFLLNRKQKRMCGLRPLASEIPICGKGQKPFNWLNKYTSVGLF